MNDNHSFLSSLYLSSSRCSVDDPVLTCCKKAMLLCVTLYKVRVLSPHHFPDPRVMCLKSVPLILPMQELCFHKVCHSSSRGKSYVSIKCTTCLSEVRVLCPQNVPLIFPRQMLCVHKMHHLSVRDQSSVSTKCTTRLPVAKFCVHKMYHSSSPGMRVLCPESVPLISFEVRVLCPPKCTTILPGVRFHKAHHSSSRGKSSVSTRCATRLTEERVLFT